MADTPHARGRDADRLLVVGVLRRDPKAEAELVKRLVPHLRAVSNALLGNRADADEAVQQSLVRVLAGLPKFRGDASLVRWARRIATNVCLRAREQNVRRLGVITDEPAADEPLGHDADPTGRHDLRRLLERLPPQQREAVVLKHVLEYSVPEIAELVAAPIETVRSRLAYGRRALRAMLDTHAAKGGAEP